MAKVEGGGNSMFDPICAFKPSNGRATMKKIES